MIESMLSVYSMYASAIHVDMFNCLSIVPRERCRENNSCCILLRIEIVLSQSRVTSSTIGHRQTIATMVLEMLMLSTFHVGVNCNWKCVSGIQLPIVLTQGVGYITIEDNKTKSWT